MVDECYAVPVDDGTVHVFPLFGRPHELNGSCWCHPEADEQCPSLLVHNVEH